MPTPVITLTTDYGLRDPLVGVLKGVILKINPEVRIVDLTHHVLPFDILDGALAIGQAYRYFPPRTVHVVVVDPGVGSQRRPILVTGEQHYFVAPDNGVLSTIYEREATVSVRHITAEHYFLHPVSNTFHGRDIFAPVAAWLTKTWQPQSFGEEIHDFVRFALPRARRSDGAVRGVVLRVDSFGNLVTSVTAEDIPEILRQGRPFRLHIGGKQITTLRTIYSDAPAGEPFAIVGSSGFLEISINRGSAARELGVSRGTELTIEIG
ncbi:MAG: SAM-dependent chlorinase/fluorinase [Firmicutes bacterium]|nr:SAM-dependent chlorinase/fluorinase [Bacillota bacterium]